MNKCSECKFGGEIIICSGTNEPNKSYWWCKATLDCVDYELGLDEEMECEFYVDKLDVNNSKA